MKLTSILLFIASIAFGQKQIITGDNINLRPVTDLVLTDGLKTTLELPRDSAKVINFVTTGTDIYDVEIIAKKRVAMPVRYDNTVATVSSGWLFNGTTTATGWHNSTMAYSNVSGTTATYTFTGTKIAVYGEKTSKHGITAFSVDNGVETMIDQYNPTTLPPSTLLYVSPTLTMGTHVIKIRCTGTKNSASTDRYSIFDYFEVTP